MNKPSGHEEISRRAHELWEKSGRADGNDVQNWLDAERELTREGSIGSAGAAAAQFSPGQPVGESHSAHAMAERAALQRKEARQPQVATHTGPKSMPAESGKPLWNQPHSS